MTVTGHERQQQQQQQGSSSSSSKAAARQHESGWTGPLTSAHKLLVSLRASAAAAAAPQPCLTKQSKRCLLAIALQKTLNSIALLV
jgi:hypothetical protein